MKRRELVKGMAAATLLAGHPQLAAEDSSMSILFMGGTGFIGPHTVRALVERGHRCTLFNRGKTNPDLFPDLELIKGDRLSDDVRQLKGRRWDVVIDTSAYVPRAVNTLLDQLGPDGVEHYVFISTISVYANFGTPGIDESAPRLVLPDPASEDVNQYYGALKAACEDAAEARLPGQVTAIRPGMIVGPGDPTDRFTYWPVRVARGGDVLAPGKPSNPIQTIDARDLANWVVHCMEQGITGAFNATSDVGDTLGSMLDSARGSLNPDASLVWVPDDFLLARDVSEWVDLPFWVAQDGALGGAFRVNTERAHRQGLVHRPLSQTVEDLHAWFTRQPAERSGSLRAGMSAEREREVLEAWARAEPA